MYFQDDDHGTHIFHKILLYLVHFAILLLQICVAVGLYQIHSILDQQTFLALKELVDAVIVVAFVEIAIGAKALISGLGDTSGVLHVNDKVADHPDKCKTEAV